MNSKHGPTRVALLTRRFGGEHAATSVRLAAYVEALAQGADVTVLTRFPFVHPGHREDDRYRGRLRVRERQDAFAVVRMRLPFEGLLASTFDALSRLVSRAARRGSPSILGGEFVEVLYGVMGLVDLFILRPDVVVVEQGPPWLALPVRLYCRSKRRLVLQVSDVKSLAMRNGRYENSTQARVRRVEAVETSIYRAANSIVTVTETMRRDIARRPGVDPDRVTVVPNGAEIEHYDIQNSERSARTREELSLGGNFVVVFASYLSASHDPGALIEVARALEQAGHHDISVLMVGSGPEERALLERVAREGPCNLKIHPGVAIDRLAEILVAADVGVSTQTAMLGERIRSKIYSYMAAALPIIATDDHGETRALLDTVDCGFVVPPGDPGEIVDAVLRLKRDPDLRRQLGTRGREYVEKFNARSTMARRFAALALGEHDDHEYTPLFLTSVVPPLSTSLDDLRSGRIGLPPHPLLRMNPAQWIELPTDDRNWRFQLHTLRFLVPALRDGSQEALADATRWIVGWSRAEGAHDADPFAWYPHGVAYRTLVLCAALHRTRSHATAPERTLLEDELVRHRSFLLDAQNFEVTNHGLVQALALAEAHLMLEGVENGGGEHDPVIRTALERFERVFRRSISRKGVHLEGSPWYHVLFIEWAATYLRHLRSVLGDGLLRELDGDIRALARNAAFFTDVNGCLLPIGDTDGVRAADLLGAAREIMPTLFESNGEAGAPQTLLDREAGYAVFKQVDAPGRSRHLVLRIPQRAPRVHGHNDALSVTLQVDGLDVFSDAGRYTYNHSDPFRKFLTSRAAHNTGDPTNRPLDRFVPVAESGLREDDGTVALLARVQLPDEDFEHRRLVTIPPPGHGEVACIEDSFAGRSGYRLRWHLGLGLNDMQIEEQDAQTAVWRDPKFGIEVRIHADHPILTECTRPSDPLQHDGWLSPSWGERAATQVVRVRPANGHSAMRWVVRTVVRRIPPR